MTNRFETVQASLKIKRSIFKLQHNHKTTFNTGDLIPIAVFEVLPGDTFSVNTAMVIRASTPIKPVMDNSFVDTHWFYVPNRIIWDNWKAFMGENKLAPWTSPFVGELPKVVGSCTAGSLADYMGLPVGATFTQGTDDAPATSLPFRAYQLIWNEWYRDQNLQYPDLVDTTDRYIQLDQMYIKKANKFPDYFTKALPAPQKGNNVNLPISGALPVYTGAFTTPQAGNEFLQKIGGATNTMKAFDNVSQQGSTYQSVYAINGGGSFLETYLGAKQNGGDKTKGGFAPDNMWADMSNATAITINQLRMSITLQQYLELDARTGTRYQEFVLSHFNVMSPDARQQRPEFLGGNRIPMAMAQVPQTSNTVATITPQGNLAAYSHTADQSSSFTKSFTEHGYILGLAVHRTKHTYQQGLARHWSRRTKYDFYDPLFANIGEQAIRNAEIYFGVNPTLANGVFGYTPAWEEYKFFPDRVSGQFRSNSGKTLDIWHYADNYTGQPVLGDQWIKEPVANMDRTLAVTSTQANQLIADIAFDITATRPMPMYGTPGLYRL